MGLSADFKKFISSQFPKACEPPTSPADGIVVDVMVYLHSFVERENDAEPAQKLVDSIIWAANGATSAVFCFDNSKDTPAAKEVEFAKRPQPTRTFTDDEIRSALMMDILPDYKNLIQSRNARTVLCDWIVEQLTTRFVTQKNMKTVYFFGTSEVPMMYTKEPAITLTLRHDLAKQLHGESDISGIYAAHILKKECNAAVVELRTVDTDWVVIGMLNPFEGLRIRLQHFDRRIGTFVSWFADISMLCKMVVTQYKIAVQEFCLLCLSKGSDYVQNAIAGFPDWPMYIDSCARELIRVKTRAGEVVEDGRINGAALHAVFVEASANKKRSKLNYNKTDGFLTRLAFNYFYFSQAPLRGGKHLNCFDFGWVRDGSGVVKLNNSYKDVISI